MDMAKLRQEGEPFDVVMNRFLAWCGEEEYCFCTWGSMDLTELQRNMAYHKLPNPFPRPLLYLDIQMCIRDRVHSESGWYPRKQTGSS